jgi:hypothetical protein
MSLFASFVGRAGREEGFGERERVEMDFRMEDGGGAREEMAGVEAEVGRRGEVALAVEVGVVALLLRRGPADDIWSKRGV